MISIQQGLQRCLSFLPLIKFGNFFFLAVSVYTDGSLQSFPLSGSTELVIEAELCGGEGTLSWQHAQLFRQSLTETAEPSFEILLHLDT